MAEDLELCPDVEILLVQRSASLDGEGAAIILANALTQEVIEVGAGVSVESDDGNMCYIVGPDGKSKWCCELFRVLVYNSETHGIVLVRP